MSDAVRKNSRKHRSLSHNEERTKTEENNRESVFLDRAKQIFPTLNIAMNMMKNSYVNPSKENSDNDLSPVKEEKSENPEKSSLRERLQEKLGELLDEQQALVELYMKAANSAREKEKLYNERITELIEQTEKDKQLMDLFKNI